jgi:Mn2+/Fe2+ NRAMP family transporter
MEWSGRRRRTTGRRALPYWLLALGPGLMVMLADTDAGSVITAAQSGARWGYSLLLPQILLIPILFGVQEVTVRLGILTKRGHGALIREQFGIGWALFSAGTLLLACMGALITEFSGIAGAGELFGLPRFLTVGAATVLLLCVALTGTYGRAEHVGIAIGALELLFIPAALLAHPRAGAMLQGLATVPGTRHGYLFLLAANVGAVIMPWMVFYQQGAVVDKRLRRSDLRISRWDTLIGAIITQVIMGAILVATAATTMAEHGTGTDLSSVGAIARALTPFLGASGARLLFGLGLVGAAFVAALVVSLAGAWGVSEVFGWRHSLNDPVPHARHFYWLYTLAVVTGAVIVLLASNLITLAVDVEVLNAILLPVVLGFLLILEARVLRPADRMRGWWRAAVWTASALVSVLGIYILLATLTGGHS